MRVRRNVLILVAFGLGAIGLLAGGAAAQSATSARIEITTVSASAYEYVVFAATDTGLLGPEVTRSDRSTIGGFSVDVEPGCYAISITLTGGPGGDWIDPISNQPAFCLEAGETEVFDTGGTTPTSSGRSIMNGDVVDPDGNRISGAVIDFFLPPAGLTFNEIRMLDHSTTDHRGAYETTRVSGESNWVFVDFSPVCRIQTLVAPEGFRWSGGRRFMNRSGCMSEFISHVAYPDSMTIPEHGWIEVQIPDGLGPAGMTGSIVPVDGGTRSARSVWFRVLGSPPYPFEGRYSVPGGCHDVQFSLGLFSSDSIFTSSGRATQNVPVCVEPGGTALAAPAGDTRTVAYDLSQPFLTGEFLTPGGTPVPEVQVDLFYPPEDLSDDELRVVDHSAADYRGPFYRSVVSGPDGRFTVPIYNTCFVATLVAPDGFSFEGERFKQMTRCQGDANTPVTLTPDRVATSYSGRVTTAAGAGVEGIMIDIFSPIAGVSDEELRIADHVATDYRDEYIETITTTADGSFDFVAAGSGCWVLTYIGVTDRSFPTGRYLRQAICAGDSPVVVLSEGGDPEPGTIKGTVTGGPEITADLFAASGDGSRGLWLGDTSTVGGAYSFDVRPGCYITVLIAPAGQTFTASGTPYQEMAACVADAETVTNPIGMLAAIP